MKDGIPHRNHSPHGCWIATYIERAAWDDEPNSAPKSRCLNWENTIILRAPDREAAFAKAVLLASTDSAEFDDGAVDGRKGHWFFEGLTSLLLICNKLEDGAEILWVEP